MQNEVAVFLSTLPARGATKDATPSASSSSISIHAPREGSDVSPLPELYVQPAFLSTLPARGATGAVGLTRRLSFDFYPRSPRGERPRRGRTGRPDRPISIHAPREGSDSGHRAAAGRPKLISIHAPREGSDGCHPGQKRRRKISIHAPREGSDWPAPASSTCSCPFLSTLPARGATTAAAVSGGIYLHFYPRSPRGERRHGPAARTGAPEHFYPRSPRGERPRG